MKKVIRFSWVFMLALFLNTFTGWAQHSHSEAACMTSQVQFSYSMNYHHYYYPGNLESNQWIVYSVTDDGVESWSNVTYTYSYGVLIDTEEDNVTQFPGVFKVCKVNYSWGDSVNGYAEAESGNVSVRKTSTCPGGMGIVFYGLGNQVATTGDRVTIPPGVSDLFWGATPYKNLDGDGRTRNPTLPAGRDYVETAHFSKRLY